MSSRERVRLLQLKLYQKAKQEESTGSIYFTTKLFRAIFWKRLAAKQGQEWKSRIDKQMLNDIETIRSEKFLADKRRATEPDIQATSSKTGRSRKKTEEKGHREYLP